MTFLSDDNLGDDEAEPDDEDDAEGEGDSGQPAGQAHAQVQAAHPLGPRAARKEKSCIIQQLRWFLLDIINRIICFRILMQKQSK